MTLRLNGSTSGYTEIDAPAIAGSNSIVLPASNGSANQFLKNGPRFPYPMEVVS